MSRLRVATAALAAGVLAVLLAGCTPTVSVKPAADANDARCAGVTVRLPSTVAGQKRDHTNGQATGAWGDPVTVQLRCGVPPLGPTGQPCTAISSGTTSVDWVLTNSPDAKVVTYVTYGRTPAVEVTIDHSSGDVSDANVLPDFGPAVATIPQSKTHRCDGQ